MEHDHTISDYHRFYIENGKGEDIAAVRVYERHGVRWLTDVWVAHDHRRQGIATRMVGSAIDRYGHEPIYLTVHSYTNRPLSDTQLIAWYGRFGFCPTDAPGVLVRMPRTGAIDGE